MIGVIITTVQKFDESMSQLVDPENVIALVDEGHRSQEGLYGIRMREGRRAGGSGGGVPFPYQASGHHGGAIDRKR